MVKENDPKTIGQKIIHDQRNLIKKMLAKNKIGQRKILVKKLLVQKEFSSKKS